MKAADPRYRLLPAIHEIDLFLQARQGPWGKRIRAEVQGLLAELRQQIEVSPSESPFFQTKAEILEWLAQRLKEHLPQDFQRVINATGVVIHTNLGRAPLAPQILEALLPQLGAYTTLEYDLEQGTRGERDGRIRQQLRQLAGTEEALAVNNNAAALYLILQGLATGREVIVSRGELVEIGGSFRIPEIMQAAGVRLIEVGTTNRTRLKDYAQAITPATAALLKVHPSNYVMRGFVEEVPVRELASLAQAHGILSFYDLGSASFYRFQQPALQEHPSLVQELKSGVDLLSFSGDKLLGATQAGIILGKQALLQRLRKHPLYRVLRLDKVTLALLEAHLQAYFEPESLPQTIPTIGLLEQTAAEIRLKAETALAQLVFPSGSAWEAQIQATESLTGGGALPELKLPSYALTLSHPQHSPSTLQAWLRTQSLPVIARIQEEQLWLDFRTIFAHDLTELIFILNRLFQTLT